MSLCFTTVVSANDYAHYIPFYLQSLALAYPHYHAKIFVRGKIKNRFALESLNKDHFHIVEDFCSDIKELPSTCSALRFLIDGKHFHAYDNVVFTDVDIVFAQQRESPQHYFEKHMGNYGYAAMGGAKHNPPRPQITENWTGSFTRVIANMFAVERKWFDKTKEVREYYLKRICKGVPDSYDNHRPASYREYDEVLLFRILWLSKMKIPLSLYCFQDGKQFDFQYRQIHLGDFRKDGVKRNPKKYFDKGNLQWFRDVIHKDLKWRELYDLVPNGTEAAKTVKKLKAYACK